MRIDPSQVIFRKLGGVLLIIADGAQLWQVVFHRALHLRLELFQPFPRIDTKRRGNQYWCGFSIARYRTTSPYPVRYIRFLRRLSCLPGKIGSLSTVVDNLCKTSSEADFTGTLFAKMGEKGRKMGLRTTIARFSTTYPQGVDIPRKAVGEKPGFPQVIHSFHHSWGNRWKTDNHAVLGRLLLDRDAKLSTRTDITGKESNLDCNEIALVSTGFTGLGKP